MFRVVTLFTALFALSSCGAANYELSTNSFLPRKGYVFVKKTVNLKKCFNDKCVQGAFVAVGSGFIVKVTYNGSYVMTASHVCAENQSDYLQGVKIKIKLQAETLDGRMFNAIMLDHNTKFDVCMMFVEDLYAGVEEVKVASCGPRPGDKIYNIASPYGIHYEDMVPIFEGRYLGKKGFESYYTFQAAPGSSGSMILNEKGELVGLLHSVFVKMTSIVVSANYGDLKYFIRKAIAAHEQKRVTFF